MVSGFRNDPEKKVTRTFSGPKSDVTCLDWFRPLVLDVLPRQEPKYLPLAFPGCLLCNCASFTPTTLMQSYRPSREGL